MQSRMGGRSPRPRFVLLVLLAIAGCSASSVVAGPLIPEDVAQDVAGQLADEQQEQQEQRQEARQALRQHQERQGSLEAEAEELQLEDDLAAGKPQQQQQRNRQLERYVRIKQSPPSHVAVRRGHRLELTCVVGGSPPARVYWLRAGSSRRELEALDRESFAPLRHTAVSQEVAKYIVECAGPEDQTVVHCVGEAGDKIVISPPTIIRVTGANRTGSGCRNDALPPAITRHRPIYIAEMGSTVVLPCEAQGAPRPRIYWTDSAGRRLPEQRFAVQENGALVVAGIRWSDMGHYKCYAESDLGIAEATSFLYPAARSADSAPATATGVESDEQSNVL